LLKNDASFSGVGRSEKRLRKSPSTFLKRGKKMKNTIKFFTFFAFLVATLFAFSANISAQNRTEILIVADQKTSCRGIVAQDCLQVKRLNEERFNTLRQNIQGFRYVEGYYYVLEVRSTNRGYRLQRILTQVKTEDLSQPVPLPAPVTLSGIDWKLTRIENRDVNSNSKAVIRFDEQNRRVSGNGGCNGFGGNLSVNGSSLRVSQVISTKMFCEQGSDVENRFFNQLERVTRYDLNNGKLQLFNGSRIVLEFERR
jgi:heat shock protein HslJ